MEACPASAIKHERELTIVERRDALRNEEFFRDTPVVSLRPTRRDAGRRALIHRNGRWSIAIVGSGPAALYTLREILQRSGSVRVTVFEKYAEIGGLLRRGVSRDHPRVREMIRLFDVPFNDDRVEVVYGTEVGVDISIGDLRRDFDAVVLACGASEPISVGSRDAVDAGDFYQAIDILVADNCELPDPVRFENLGPRCAVIGAGNVALDIVRYIVARRVHAVADAVTELLVLSRSDRVAFTPSAFYEIADLENVEVVVDSAGSAVDMSVPSRFLRDVAGLEAVDVTDADDIGTNTGTLRVILSFGSEVTDIEKMDRGLTRIATSSGRAFMANSVISAAGFRMKELGGIPVSDRGVVLNRQGRVISRETGEALEGLYVTGWAKRGSTGGVGDNRVCAAETVAQLATDLARKSVGARFVED